MAQLGPTIEQAYDAIFGAFRVAWEAGTPALNSGASVPVEWPNVDYTGQEPLSVGNSPWARVSLQHTLRDQHAMGPDGKKVFTSTGIVSVQIFVPLAKRGLVDLARLGKVALDAFEGKRTSDVWFRRAAYKEVGRDGEWFQANVTADFTYDVVK